MTDEKQCCGNCHWFKANGKSPLGGCEAPIPESAQSCYWMDTGMGTTCPTFRPRGERLPQRFRYRLVPDGEWSYGVCWWVGGMWRIRTENGCASFNEHDDPKRAIKTMLLAPRWMRWMPLWFEWIDRDYGWEDVTA